MAMIATESPHPQRRRRNQPMAATAKTAASNKKTMPRVGQGRELSVSDRIQAPGAVEESPGKIMVAPASNAWLLQRAGILQWQSSRAAVSGVIHAAFAGPFRSRSLAARQPGCYVAESTWLKVYDTGHGEVCPPSKRMGAIALAVEG